MEEHIKSKLLGLQAGALVVLTVISERGIETRYQGLCTLFREQEDWTEHDYVSLTDAVDVTHNTKSIRPHFFSIPSILNVEVIQPTVASSEKENDFKDECIEEIFPTTVITEREQLEELVETLRGVQVLGFSFEGQNIGRFGSVKWVNLLVNRTIVALHVQPLSMNMGRENNNNLWSKLESAIFSNPNIVKVVHDCRAAADYLFHQHGIKIMNFFDTMVADIYYRKTIKKDPLPDEFTPLSKCLQHYLPGSKVHSQELALLREYENDRSLVSGWLMEPLPPPKSLKVGAIKIKYLLSIREVLLWHMLEGYRSIVNSRIDYVLSKS